MADQPNESQKALLDRLHASIVRWTDASRYLTVGEKAVIGFRAGLQIIPFGIGAALDAGYFGTIDARRSKRIEETLACVTEQVLRLGESCASAVKQTYFETHEFAVLFEACWRQILLEAQHGKLHVLRCALVSIIVDSPSYTFAKRNLFVESLSRMSDAHIREMQVFHNRFRLTPDTFETQEIWNILGASTDADRDYCYAALDVLANLRYIEHRTVPQVEGGRIDFPRQKFRLTALGSEFLDFVRSSDGSA